MTTPQTPPLTEGRIWWHGGPRIRGNWVTAPSARTSRRHKTPGSAGGVADPARVYLHIDPAAALLHAAGHLDPWLYVVLPHGTAEYDPDWLGEPGLSIAVPRARIMHRHQPTAEQVADVRAVLLQVQP